MLTVGATAVLALTALACGDDDSETTGTTAATAATATAATTTAATTVPATEPAATTLIDIAPPPSSAPASSSAPAAVPERIVSLSPTATEMLFAIGAGGQVVAVDSLSTYPPETADVVTEMSAYEPNVEAVAGYEPDLVITDGSNPEFLTQLDAIDVPHWEGPAAVNLDDAYAQIEQLGAATGHPDEAAALVDQMRNDIEKIVADVPATEVPLTMYHELDDTYFSVTSDTFIGQVYSLVGLRNIADEAETDAGPYPQLNAEFIISTNPDLIFLADAMCCGQTAEIVSARPGWDAITAVTNGSIVELDEDIASRWGPRVVDLVQTVADAATEAST
jgi:iron complex transport system substrate-binding protein